MLFVVKLGSIERTGGDTIHTAVAAVRVNDYYSVLPFCIGFFRANPETFRTVTMITRQRQKYIFVNFVNPAPIYSFRSMVFAFASRYTGLASYTLIQIK